MGNKPFISGAATSGDLKATTMRKNRYTYLHEIDLSTDRVKNVYKELVKEL